MFPAVDKDASFSERELAIGEFWKEHGIYEKTLAAREGAPPFVFYEGPPTANGMPHPGHCLTRASKDLFPRYRTMRGYRCERKAGWDTHGLPVEVEVCKELGIHSKEEIEAYGIEPFIQKCQQSVWRYMQEWERLTERLGFWVNLREAYVTYHQSYVESVWWSLKQLYDRGLLYQGHKIVWWWAQGGTALSAGEVGQGYREVADPSVYVKFPLLDEDGNVTDTSLLVWTTTPWTLPSNQFAAVNPELEYSVVEFHHDDTTTQRLIIASALVETIAGKVKAKFNVLSMCSGKDLVGRRYLPPFDFYYQNTDSWGDILLAYDPRYLEDNEAHFEYWKSLLEEMGVDEEPNSTADASALLLDAVKREFSRGGRCEWLRCWRIIDAEFVTTESGSGVVHIAPAFGEDDKKILDAVWAHTVAPFSFRPKLINAVAPNGNFTDEAPEFVRGRWVKDCDKDIIRDLKSRGLLFHQEQYRHDYPFCWRAEEDPLIQYPRESWFIKTTEFKDAMLANNAEINWLPEHIQTGRFGKFLESNVDWALSRERYWGTPLPIWECGETGRMEAIGSYEELMAKPGVTGDQVWIAAKEANPELPDDLRVHKPYIDAVTYDSPFAEGARMSRVTEVIDCWYDSGAMPFAQWGFRGQESGPEREKFEEQFPADFISEAIDQTRGWFYSQLAISTMMFGMQNSEGGLRNEPEIPQSAIRNPHSYPHPFRNCIVLGLMLGEDGQKMSKSKRNYRDPSEIFDLYGADALRWYFFANQPPWTSIRYSEQAIKDSIPEFLLRLWNVYSFFTIYANIDEFDPAGELGGRSEVGGQRSEVRGRRSESDWLLQQPVTHAQNLESSALAQAPTYRPFAERGELDRWILSELNATCIAVVERMDAYDNYGACQAITAFVDGLSNWYVRRSRDRFWAKEKRSTDKLDAYWTLYECLLTTARMIAPFVPYLAEAIWQNLAAALFGEQVHESVHLCNFPEGDPAAVDAELSQRMDLVRQISSLGRQARGAANLKVRQPLAKVEVILTDAAHQQWLESHADLIAEELNVKAVEFATDAQQYIDYTILPNFKRLGPKLGKNMPQVKKLLGASDGGKLLAELKAKGKIVLDLGSEQLELDDEDIEIRLQAKEGWAAAEGRGVVVVLATELTHELLSEGVARDLVRIGNDVRKSIGLEISDRVACVHIVSNSSEYLIAARLHETSLLDNLLARKLETGSFEEYKQRIEDHKAKSREKSGLRLEMSYKIEGEEVLILIDRIGTIDSVE